MTTEISGNEASPNPFDAKQYWENRLGANPSLREVGYSMLGASYNKWLYRMRRNVVRKEVATVNSDLRDARVLDIGSGTGFYLDLWHELGARSVYGCDLTQAAVTYLRKRFPSNPIYQADIGGDLPAEVQPGFDVISAFDVLFHIVDNLRFHRALQNIASLLRPGGLFYFTDSFLHYSQAGSAHHVSHTLDEIQHTLSNVGLEVLTRRPVFVSMNEPLDCGNRVWPLFWRLFMYPVKRSEIAGNALGTVLYCVDSVLVRLLNESPTTEIMVCRRIF